MPLNWNFPAKIGPKKGDRSRLSVKLKRCDPNG